MAKNTEYQGRSVYIVDGNRTPFLKARGKPGPFSAADLGVQAAQTLLARQPFEPNEIDEVITGCVLPNPDEANISRVISMRIGCGSKVPAWTVQRNCASGMQALDNAAHDIASGRAEIVLAGGVEAMSRAPLLFSTQMVKWLAGWSQAKGFAKVQQLTKFRLNYLAPVIALLRGLNDPLIGMSMGQTAEKIAHQFKLTREQMDEFALRSHQRLAQAQHENTLTEISTIYDRYGKYYQHDDGVRPENTLEQLAKLAPYFDRKYGSVTAGNSSQITDGAAYLILASREAVKKYKLPVIGKIVDVQWAALDPDVMGYGPIFAATPLMQRHNLKLNDVDYWEINEAFAAQVLACLAAWNDDTFCRENLGLKEKMGELNQERLNVYGDAISMGHPIGASGARVVLQLLHTLRRNQAKTGIAALCIGGGQGGAMLIESTDTVEKGE